MSRPTSLLGPMLLPLLLSACDGEQPEAARKGAEWRYGGDDVPHRSHVPAMVLVSNNRGAVMAVLIRHRTEGMTPSQYDEISPPLVEKLKTQPGFVAHVAFMDNGRFTVSEIWESQEQHDRWFDENVKPNIPGVEQEVVELHAVHTP